MKKIFTILLVGLACLSFASCNNDKEISEEVKKGDVSNWYYEIISIGAMNKCLIHSTFDCPSVKNGVIPIRFVGDNPGHSFCTKCMNEELIKKCYEWFEEREKAKKNEGKKQTNKDEGKNKAKKNEVPTTNKNKDKGNKQTNKDKAAPIER